MLVHIVSESGTDFNELAYVAAGNAESPVRWAARALHRLRRVVESWHHRFVLKRLLHFPDFSPCEEP